MTNNFKSTGKIKVIKGTILQPQNAGLRFILSINNLLGKLNGNPLLKVFDRKWPKVSQESRGIYVNKTGAYKLGAVVGVTAVQSDIWVMHCLVQDEEMKVNLESLNISLKEICKMAKYEHASVHVSTLLTDLIPELSGLLDTYLVSEGLNVYYYEEPSS